MTFSDDFVIELFQTCLNSEKITAICQRHVKLTYFQAEPERAAFKTLFNYVDLNQTLPTLGLVSQNVKQSEQNQEFLIKVKNNRKVPTERQVLEELELFIKKNKFIVAFEETVDNYNGGHHEKAINTAVDKFLEASQFSLKSDFYVRVFGQFNERQIQRQSDALNDSITTARVSYGLPSMDAYTGGGMLRGTSTCFMARSGGGKSTILKYIGAHNTAMGMIGVHFQGEGSKKECLELYDACWSGIAVDDIELDNLKDSIRDKIEKSKMAIISNGGELFVYATEEFDSMTIEECHEVVVDIVKLMGRVDFILFDYAELFGIAGQFNFEQGERKRREMIANKMTNMAIEFKAAVVTATQAMDVTPDQYNNPNFILTRSHISEYKGFIKPFSNFITINQTDDEKTNSIVRLYADKFRKKISGKSFYAVQALNSHRFFNLKKTREMFPE